MALKDDLADALAEEGDDAQCDAIGAAIGDYASSLKIAAAVVAGSDAAGGTFAGAGQGTMKVDGSQIASALKQAAQSMSSMTAGGDAVYAVAFSTGLMAAVPQFTVNITGTTTPPPPASPYPSADAGMVTAVFNPAPVVATLQATFAAMSSMTSGGDDKYAEDLASAIQMFYTKPVTCIVAGQTHLSGSQGQGQISE